MALTDMYTQCELRNETLGIVDVAWIPTELAKIGKKLTILGVNGYVVTDRYVSLPREQIMHHTAARKHFAENLEPHR